MKNNKKIISTIILTVIVSVLAIATISQAADFNEINKLFSQGNKAIGKTIGTIGKTGNNINLYSSENLYCVERWKGIDGENTYKVKKYIEIEGNVAKIYNDASDSNPASFASDSNAILAYILGGGNEKKGFGSDAELGMNPRQLAMWMYWNEWAVEAKKSLNDANYVVEGTNGITEMTLGSDLYNRAKAIIDEAKNNYAKNPGSVASIKITNSDKNISNLVKTNDNCELVGPIKLNFKGNLSSIEIKSTDNSYITEYELYDKNKNKISGLESIKSDNEFYVKNTSKTKKINNIKFNVTANKTIKAKFYIIENEKKDTQRLIIADAKTQPVKASVTLNVEREQEGNISIYKKDSVTGEGLKGAKFKIQIQYENNRKGWLALDKIGTYNYNATNDNATEFETNDNGYIYINNLKSGLQFKVFEVKAPNGYDLKDQYGYDKTQDRVWCNKAIYTIKKDTTIPITMSNVNTGDIKIEKSDKDNHEKLNGAVFKIAVKGSYKDSVNKNEKMWLKQISEDPIKYDYTSSFADATPFTTQEIDEVNGTKVISGLSKNYAYHIFEIEAPKGYDLTAQEGYDKENNWVDCGPAIVNSNKTTYVTLENESTLGNLEIIKKDPKKPDQTLEGAEFKLSAVEVGTGNKSKQIWVKQNSDGTYSYNATFEEATAFTTNKDGIVKLEKIEKQRYYIYETKAPTGYDITAQTQYDPKEGWVAHGSVTVGERVDETNTTKVGINNNQYIAIEGYVWVEKPGSKQNDYNDIVDNGEEIITDKVTIKLMNKDGKIVAQNPKIVERTAFKGTDHEVKVLSYRFERVVYDNLKDYYIEFNYKENYGNYITVTPNYKLAEGSKAISEEVPAQDKDLTGIATTYKGEKDESEYGLSGLATKFYNEETYTLENINLGIKELPKTDFTVSETMAYVDVKLKGYNYRYIYGGTEVERKTVPTVKYQSETDKECYTRKFYPSDITYENSKNPTQELQAYVTYRIDVTNNTNLDVPYLYQENTLNITRVLNRFDTNRYELSDGNWDITDNKEVAKMKENYLREKYYDKYNDDSYAECNGISNETDKNNKYAFITFKIKPEAIKGILKIADGTIEDFPTEAQVTAYHKYTRIDSSWKNYNDSTENKIQQTQTHFTSEDIKNDKAPYLILKQGENRTISGTVFEDKNVMTNGELVGNGIYDENENVVKDVTVELGNYNDGKFIPTDLYQVDSIGNNILDANNNRTKAKMKTAEMKVRDKTEIRYSFEGVVPGEYFLRFTYGNGEQKIVDLNGREVGNVTSNKYKSTIVTDEIRKVFETKYDPTKATWYMGLQNENNLAVDDLDIRKDLSKEKYTVTNSTLEEGIKADIVAYTPQFSIPIEFTESNETSVAENQYPSELGKMNFGIIELPRTRIDISKKITNIQLIRQNGGEVFSGNPADQNIAQIKDLDMKTKNGSTYVDIELDSNDYGGQLNIKYQIEVINNSDLDYIESLNDNHFGNYYKYGDKTYATEKSVKINKVYDYLDPKVAYKPAENTSGITEINLEDLRKKSELSVEESAILNSAKSQKGYTELDYNTILEITGFTNALYSSKGAKQNDSSKTIEIETTHTLDSASNEDAEFINIAEVMEIETSPITAPNVEPFRAATTQEESYVYLPTSNKATLTITPSTGGNRSMVSFIIGTIALVIVAGGIVLIRRNSKK